MKKILVGFSVNAEITAHYTDLSLEKGELHLLDATPGGTSFNVSRTLKNLGSEPKMLLLSGLNGDFHSHTLNFVLQNCDIAYKIFPLLEKSNIALINDDNNTRKLFGYKGNLLYEDIEKVSKVISFEEGDWSIATGLRLEEVPLALSLFSKIDVVSSLNPRPNLINNKKVFHDLLKYVKILIINKDEYWACGVTSLAQFHSFGPELVVVTDGENGGQFSFRNEAKIFNADNSYATGKIFQTGAGDCFHGSLVHSLSKLRENFTDLSFDDVEESIKFAARIAGKKITLEGSSNCPTLEDFM